MNTIKLEVKDVVGAVVILNLTSSPVKALNMECLARFGPGRKGDVGVPSVVEAGLRGSWLLKINLDSSANGTYKNISETYV